MTMMETKNKPAGGRNYLRLGEILISAGMLTEQELEEGIALQKGTNKRLGTVLLENNFITENELIEALQMQLGIEFIDLTKEMIPTELAQMLPKNIAKQYSVVPVRVVRDELYLAMQDPLNFYAIEEVRKAVHKRVVPMVATASAIERSIQLLYGNEGAAKAIEEMRAAPGSARAIPPVPFPVPRPAGGPDAGAAYFVNVHYGDWPSPELMFENAR